MFGAALKQISQADYEGPYDTHNIVEGIGDW